MTVRKSANQCFGIVFHAANPTCILVKEHKKHCRTRCRASQVPTFGLHTADNAQAEYRGDTREPRNEKSEGLPVVGVENYFRKYGRDE